MSKRDRVMRHTMSSNNNLKPKNQMDSDQSSSSEEEEVERELADFSFEELHRARSSGFVSVNSKKDSTQNKHARANKNRPMEASSKKPAKRLRQVIEVPKKEVRDPRFESLCGDLDVDGFRKRYGFLFEEELPKERETLQKMLKKSRDPKSVEELKGHISWIAKGKLEAFMAKRRRRNASKEHRNMPYRRLGDGEQ
ncbi:rRNA biogenesis protein [Nymphaea thermarum]|nr:rRNA biogenesis protein [Nymphaea thermarum]